MKHLLLTAIAALGALVASLLRPIGAAIERHMTRSGLMLHAITSDSKIAQGQTQRYSYYHLDDAATPALITLYPGFKPSYVKLVNITDRITYEWEFGMTQGDYIKTVAAGTRTLETDDVLDVERDTALRPTITIAASIVLQNKKYSLTAVA